MDNVEMQMKSILESISSMALSDYSKKAIITDSKDPIDTIAAGVNMLSNQIEKMMTELQIKTELLNKSEEISHLGSWMLDLKTNTLTWSDENYRIFGLQPQEFKATYEAFLEIIHPDDRAKVNEAYSGSIEQGKDGYEIEHRIVHKHTGEIRRVREKCLHNRDNADQIISSVGYTHDVTDHYKAQELIKKNERRLNTAQRIAQIGSWELDLLTDELTWSDEMYNIFSLNPETYTPEIETLIDHIKDEYKFMMRKWIAGAKLGNDQPAFDFLLDTKDASIKWVNGQGEILFNKDGVAVRAFGTAQDVTTNKEALEKERHLSELKSRFVTIASHQFRTPMTIIQSNSQLLGRIIQGSNLDLKPKLDKATSRIKNAITNMTSLMDDMLILNRINSIDNALVADKTPMDLINFCSQFCTIYNEFQTDHRVIDFDHSGNPIQVEIDRDHMNYVLNNLVSNAFKYSKNANPKIEIFFDHELVRIVISDSGMGIPEKDIPNLFQPFYRASNVENISGTGLGLSIAKEYIELIEGKISVESKLNESTSFTISLPGK